MNKKPIKDKSRYIPHRYLGFCPAPYFSEGNNYHNSLGYRGREITLPKPDGEFRIICLGDSTTYSDQIKDFRFSYPDLLEKELMEKGYSDITVINAGAGGYSSWETLIDFEMRIIDLEPDLITIYPGVNDIHCRFVWPKEFYLGDNSGRRIANHALIYMPSIWEHSALLRMLSIKMGFLKPHSRISRTLSVASSKYYGDEFSKQKKNGIYPSGIFREISARDMLINNPPRYLIRNIENIIAIAKFRRIEVLIVTFAYSPLFYDRPRAASEEYVSSYEEHNDILKLIAEETGVHLFDLASLFPKGKEYFVDGRHVNIEGSKLQARLLANFIDEEQLIIRKE
ncbi:MAG: hypothetical protein JW882_02535 [Deltaproteobacteria bacterium]|nr:hypothetical protein [Deltaproteobacteria bacterium]